MNDIKGLMNLFSLILAAIAVGCILTCNGGDVEKTTNNESYSTPKEEPNSTERIAWYGELQGREAIRQVAKNPNSVDFRSKVFEQYYPNQGTYIVKFNVTATNSYGGRVQAIGVASLHFNGMDCAESKNWDINWAKIENKE